VNPPTFADIWAYIGPLIGAIIGIVGKYLLDRRKERLTKRESLQVVECVELVNAKVLDVESLGPIAARMQIKVPKAGPGSELVDVQEVYFARYRFRNLSDVPLSKLLVDLKNGPKPVTFSIEEGEARSGPDWERQLHTLLEEEKGPEERGWEAFPIPYLNPYSSTRHEVFLDVSSYLPLHEVEVVGGAKGVRFIFKKSDV
jgi:hypothetical protein